MNNEIINLPTLISRIAATAGVEPAVARRFLHELFVLIESEVISDEKVEIAGVGSFCRQSPEEISVHASENPEPIVFIPDAILAEKINEPFSAFSPVEVSEGAERELGGVKESVAPNDIKIPAIPREQVAEDEPLAEPDAAESTIISDEAPKIETAVDVKPQPEPEPDPEPEPEPETSVKNDTEPSMVPESETETVEILEPSTVGEHEPAGDELAEEYEEEPRKAGHTLWLMLGILIGVILGLVGGYFAGKSMGKLQGDDSVQMTTDSLSNAENDLSILEPPVDDNLSLTESSAASIPSEDNTPVVNTPEQENIPVEAAQPTSVSAPVVDRVVTTLAALAQKHYGNKNYWIFIYEENPKLTNPNVIAPGTAVEIPPLESFSEATAELTQRKASQRMAALSKKYKL